MYLAQTVPSERLRNWVMMPDLAVLHRSKRMSGSLTPARSLVMMAVAGFQVKVARMAAAVWPRSWAMKADLADIAQMVGVATVAEAQV